MFRSGAFVAQAIDPVTDAQIQPNGVDLRLGSVHEQVEAGRLGRDDRRIGARRELDPTDGWYRLDPGTYVVRYAETVRVPAGHLGLVLPRSSLMRNGASLDTAVWDAGYEGRGEGLLRAARPIELEAGTRLCQFVLAAADHREGYDGRYQGEGIDD